MPCHKSSRSSSRCNQITVDLDDLITNLTSLGCPFFATENSEKSKEKTVLSNNEAFRISLDLSEFQPEEISVRVIDDFTIKVEAKHEEKEAEYGTVYRHFIRNFNVPEVYDLAKIESKLSPGGQMRIVVPVIGGTRRGDVEIPVIRE